MTLCTKEEYEKLANDGDLGWAEFVEVFDTMERYREALSAIAFDDGGRCHYAGHDGARDELDPECPGAECWAKRALLPEATHVP